MWQTNHSSAWVPAFPSRGRGGPQHYTPQHQYADYQTYNYQQGYTNQDYGGQDYTGQNYTEQDYGEQSYTEQYYSESYGHVEDYNQYCDEYAAESADQCSAFYNRQISRPRQPSHSWESRYRHTRTQGYSDAISQYRGQYPKQDLQLVHNKLTNAVQQPTAVWQRIRKKAGMPSDGGPVEPPVANLDVETEWHPKHNEEYRSPWLPRSDASKDSGVWVKPEVKWVKPVFKAQPRTSLPGNEGSATVTSANEGTDDGTGRGDSKGTDRQEIADRGDGRSSGRRDREGSDRRARVGVDRRDSNIAERQEGRKIGKLDQATEMKDTGVWVDASGKPCEVDTVPDWLFQDVAATSSSETILAVGSKRRASSEAESAIPKKLGMTSTSESENIVTSSDTDSKSACKRSADRSARASMEGEDTVTSSGQEQDTAGCGVTAREVLRCDYCTHTEEDPASMQPHLQATNHYSASTYLEGKAVCVQPLVVRNQEAKSEGLVVVCPVCTELFDDIFLCGVHCDVFHSKPGLYSLTRLVRQQECIISKTFRCLECQEHCDKLKTLNKHWRKYPSHKPLSTTGNTVSWFTCIYCKYRSNRDLQNMIAHTHLHHNMTPGDLLLFQVLVVEPPKSQLKYSFSQHVNSLKEKKRLLAFYEKSWNKKSLQVKTTLGHLTELERAKSGNKKKSKSKAK